MVDLFLYLDIKIVSVELPPIPAAVASGFGLLPSPAVEVARPVPVSSKFHVDKI